MQMEMFLNNELQYRALARVLNGRITETHFPVDDQDKDVIMWQIKSAMSTPDSESNENPEKGGLDENIYHYVPEFLNAVLTLLTEKCRFDSTSEVGSSEVDPKKIGDRDNGK